MDAAEILAYYDSTEWQDATDGDRDPEHRRQLVETLCEVAIGRDRDLLELVIRAGIERGRGAELLEVIADHRDQALGAEQLRAESVGEIEPIRGGPRKR